MMITKHFDKIKIEPDTVGIISKLTDIKNPTTDEKNPSMLCFIACINYDNSQLKNKIATRNTLEFAMSVSASNGPPEKITDHAILTKIPAEKLSHTPPNKEENRNVTRPDLIQLAIKNSNLTKRIKNAKNDDDAKIEAIRKFVANNYEGKSEYYNLLKANNKISKFGIDQGQEDYIIKAFIKEYMRDPRGTGISNVLTQYKNLKNKELVRSAARASGGTKVRTRKRKSRREKKNRMTRRLNRI
jgi:hypothetical protein